MLVLLVVVLAAVGWFLSTGGGHDGERGELRPAAGSKPSVAPELEASLPVDARRKEVRSEEDLGTEPEPSVELPADEPPGGAAVAGRVIVDGAAPRRPFTLFLSTDDSVSPMRKLDTAPDGSFRFGGLSPSWSGALGWGSSYHTAVGDLASDEHRLELDRPQEAVELLLVEGPALVGRVVDPTDGLPAPETTVRYSFSNQSSTWQGGLITDKSGRFRVSLHRPAPSEVELEVFGPDRDAPKTHDLSRPEGREGVWDVGDVAFASRVTLVVFVRGPSGAPLAGAVARAWLGDDSPGAEFGADSPPSDDGGRTAVVLTAESKAVRVVRPGYTSVAAPIPRDTSRPLHVTLGRACLLELRLVDPPPGDLNGRGEYRGLQLILRSREPLFRDTLHWGPEDFGTAAADLPGLPPRRSMWSTGADGGALYLGVRANGYMLSGVQPGVAIDAEVVDAFGHELAERSIPPLSSNEHRTVELKLAGPLRSLRGIVIDSAGKPTSRATVRIAALDETVFSGNEHARTDAEGRFEVANVGGAEVKLGIQAGGHAPLVRERYAVPAEPDVFQLDPGLSVEVRVEWEDGSIAEACDEVAAVYGGLSFPGERLEPGVFLVHDLPDAEVRLSARFGFRYFHQHHHPSVAAASLTVPAPFELTVALDLAEEPAADADVNLRMTYAETGKLAVWQRVPRTPKLPSSVTVPMVFAGTYSVWLELGPDQLLTQPAQVTVGAGTPATVVLR